MLQVANTRMLRNAPPEIAVLGPAEGDVKTACLFPKFSADYHRGGDERIPHGQLRPGNTNKGRRWLGVVDFRERLGGPSNGLRTEKPKGRIAVKAGHLQRNLPRMPHVVRVEKGDELIVSLRNAPVPRRGRTLVVLV